MPFRHGERVGVRGGRQTPTPAHVAAPHPDPLPVKNGERELTPCGPRRRGRCPPPRRRRACRGRRTWSEEQPVHRRLVAMRQVPVEHLVHEAARGVARVEVAEDDAAAGAQLVVGPIDQRDRQLVAQVVDEVDGVDQVLGRQLQLLPAGGEMDQVAVQRADLVAELLAPGRCAATWVSASRSTSMQLTCRRALVVGFLEHVEHLARRTAGEARDVELLRPPAVGRQRPRSRAGARRLRMALSAGEVEHAGVDKGAEAPGAGRRIVVDRVDGLVVAGIAARLGAQRLPVADSSTSDTSSACSASPGSAPAFSPGTGMLRASAANASRIFRAASSGTGALALFGCQPGVSSSRDLLQNAAIAARGGRRERALRRRPIRSGASRRSSCAGAPRSAWRCRGRSAPQISGLRRASSPARPCSAPSRRWSRGCARSPRPACGRARRSRRSHRRGPAGRP